MANILKNGAITQRYSIMILPIMFKEAIKEDIISEYMYPFSKLTLKKDTEKRVFLNNKQYQLHSPEEELLLTWFEPCEKEADTIFINASQIASKLAESTKLNLNDATINKLGKALKKHNFIRLKYEGIYVYTMLEKTYEDLDNNNKVV